MCNIITDLNFGRSNQAVLLKVITPINVDIYQKNRPLPLLEIDCYSSTPENDPFFGRLVVVETINNSAELIIKADAFEKKIICDIQDNTISINVSDLCEEHIILANFNRARAIRQLICQPTTYAFNILAKVGKEEDLTLLTQLNNHFAQIYKLDLTEFDEEILDDTVKLHLGCVTSIYHICLRHSLNDWKKEIKYAYSHLPAYYKHKYGYLFPSNGRA